MFWLFLSGVVSGGVVTYLAATRFGWWTTAGPFTAADSDEAILDEAREAVQARIEKRKSRIVTVVKTEGSITTDGVEDLYCISRSTATRYLQQLVEEGKLVRTGAGRSTVYTLPK